MYYVNICYAQAPHKAFFSNVQTFSYTLHFVAQNTCVCVCVCILSSYLSLSRICRGVCVCTLFNNLIFHSTLYVCVWKNKHARSPSMQNRLLINIANPKNECVFLFQQRCTFASSMPSICSKPFHALMQNVCHSMLEILAHFRLTRTHTLTQLKITKKLRRITSQFGGFILLENLWLNSKNVNCKEDARKLVQSPFWK